MASAQQNLADRVASAQRALEETSKQRAESRIRSGSTSGIPTSPTSRNAAGSVSEPKGKATDNGGGRAGTPGMEAAERARRVISPTAGQDADSSAEDEAEEEAPAPRQQRTPPGRSPPQRQTQPTIPEERGESSARQVSNNSAIANFSNLTPEQNALLNELADINGQDSYDALAAGIGKLKKSEFLLLPRGFQINAIPAADVGKPSAHRHLSIRVWAQIYALNKSRAPEGADAKVFAMLRLEAVKCGWLFDQREISFADPPADSINQLATDMADVAFKDRIGLIKTASFLVPLVAEHVFRTFGHHFISTDAANYQERYTSTFRSCLMPEISTLLPAPVLYHAALHWVSPGRARNVLLAQLASPNIPDAIRIRVNAAPAGTAILTTTSAILKSMHAVGLDVLFQRHGGFSIANIHNMTEVVKANPAKYHKSYFAYGVAPPSATELTALESAKDEAIRFAPFAQAYINTYMREAALGKAQALKKHADQNPVNMRRAQNLFRSLQRGDVTTVAALFTKDLAASPGDIDNDNDFEVV